MQLQIKVHFDCAGSQLFVGSSGCSRCGAVRILGLDDHFLWQAPGKPRVLVVQRRAFCDRRRRSEL